MILNGFQQEKCWEKVGKMLGKMGFKRRIKAWLLVDFHRKNGGRN